MWLTLFSQSMVNPPFVSLVFWLWLITGLMIRSSIKKSDSEYYMIDDVYTKDTSASSFSSRIRFRFSMRSTTVSLVTTLSAIIVLAGIWNLNYELRYQSAIRSRDGEALIALMSNPWSTPDRLLYTIQVTYQSGLIERSFEIADLAARRFPNDFKIVLSFYELSKLSKRLDKSSLTELEHKLTSLDSSWRK
jgi:hypothetical protein